MRHEPRLTMPDSASLSRPRLGFPEADVLQHFSSGVSSTLAMAASETVAAPDAMPAEEARHSVPVVFSVPEMRAKRAMDATAAFVLLALLAPLLAVIAFAIRLQGGPVLYGHRRLGRGLREFRCLKFRTMRTDGDEVLARLLDSDPEARREWRETRKLRDDPRVTRLGRLLRRTSLDELPQLINVLRGEMSLVGPRPVVREELDEHYGAAAAAYALVRPGITGLWQVSGRSDTTYRTRVALDTEYVATMSLANDAMILLRTVGVVLRGLGAV